MSGCRFVIAFSGMVVVLGGWYAVAQDIRPAGDVRPETPTTPGPPEGRQEPDSGYGALLSAPDLARKGKQLDGPPGRAGTPVAPPAETER